METDRDEEEDDHGGHPPDNCQPRPRSPHRRARLAPCVSGPGQGTMKEGERKENVKKRKKIAKMYKNGQYLKILSCRPVVSCIVKLAAKTL